MLYLVGIGLNPRQLTLEAVDAVKACGRVFLESYTSRFSDGTASELEELLEKRIEVLERGKVEEDFSGVLKSAQKENVALLVFGNPLFATTHIQVLLDAHKLKIQTRVIAGISIQNYLGESGLDAYKFGRVCTVVFAEPHYAPESFFDVIEANQKLGLHTLCLLDIRTEENRFMSVWQALEFLQSIAKKRKSKLLEKLLFVGLYGVGSPNQEIVKGNADALQKFNSDSFPQSLLVCGKLNEKEKEALALVKNA